MAWNDLTLSDKARMINLAVKSGITDLKTIHEVYNRFDEGGNVENSELTPAELLNNSYSKGGKIHIKPENRGKFTALKERTGHSATWFKEHGTPAQKKMAVFALNARKWKHAEGGPLEEETPFVLPENTVPTYFGPYNEETIAQFQKEIENPTSPKAYREASLALSRMNSPKTRLYYDKNFPYYEYVTRKDADDYEKKLEIDTKYNIPYIPEKRIVLTNAGPLTGAELSTNMIDSISKYAFETDLPLVDAFGLSSETTFGKFPSTTYLTPRVMRELGEHAKENGISSSLFVSNGGVNPTDLLNFHNFYNNSYNDAIGEIARKLGTDGEFIHDASRGYINARIDPIAKRWYADSLDSLFKRGYTYADKKYVAPKDENPLKAAFEFYKSGRWNPGDPTIAERVKRFGEAFLNSPEYKKYLNEKKK